LSGPLTIRWVARPELCVAQAAYVVATGSRCVDPKLEQRLVEPVTGINTRLISASIDVAAFWQHYRREVARTDDGRASCAAALLAAGCSELQLEQTTKAVSSRLSECRTQFQHRFPKLEDQLKLRGRPLSEQWNECGTGLLRQIQRRIWGTSPPDNWWPTRIDGLLVQPMRGGDGGYQLSPPSIWMEAMLTDADPAVPEVLRLASLVTGLAIERHLQDSAGQLAQAWQLAVVPLVLAAARELELIRGATLPIAEATRMWQLGGDSVADILRDWWLEAAVNETSRPIAVHELWQRLDAQRHLSPGQGPPPGA
jgi:hypothetical protein